MNYRRLGRTGLKVSELCLGTMQWGWTANEAESFTVMDAFVEAGGNFLDTADVYSRWVEGNPGGVSEQIIGRWLKARGNRQAVVVATKARGRMWDGPNGEGLSRAHYSDVRARCAGWARTISTCTRPTRMTARRRWTRPCALDDLVRAGRCATWAARTIKRGGCAALWTSEKHRLVRFDSISRITWRTAEFERELLPLCNDQGLGIIPYSPLAGGFLTGKYRRDSVPDSQRAEGIKQRYFNDRGFAIVDALDRVAQAHGSTPTAVALAWLLAQPGMTAPIIGANSPEQLNASLAATELQLTAEDLAALNDASKWE